MTYCECNWPATVELDGFIKCAVCLQVIICEICDKKPSVQTHVDYCVCDNPICMNAAISNVSMRGWDMEAWDEE